MATKIGKFERYTPDPNSDYPFKGKGNGRVQYVWDEHGNDWYNVQKTLPASPAFYIGTDDDLIVVCADEDATKMFPVGITVWRIDEDGLDAMSLYGKRFDPVTDEFHPYDPPAQYISSAQAEIQFGDEPDPQGELPSLWDRVERIIYGDAYRAMKVYLTKSTTWERSSPYVQALAYELWPVDVADDNMDAVFLRASKR